MLCISSDLHTILRIVCLPHCPPLFGQQGAYRQNVDGGGMGGGIVQLHAMHVIQPAIILAPPPLVPLGPEGGVIIAANAMH